MNNFPHNETDLDKYLKDMWRINFTNEILNHKEKTEKEVF